MISGNVTNGGDIGVYGNSGVMIEGNLNNNANLNVSSNATTQVSGNVTNNGQVSVSGNSTTIFGGNLVNNASNSSLGGSEILVTGNSLLIVSGNFSNGASVIISQNSSTVVEGNLNNGKNFTVSSNSSALILGSFENNANLNISSGSVAVVSGNFTQSPQGQIVFTFNPSSQQNNNKSVQLNVGGCVSINGNISLNLETQPQQGTTNFQVISYNCSQQVNISSSQIQVVPNYNGSSCDTINSQAINQPGSLGISLTSTLGNKCNGGNGKNLGLVIGLAVGIPVGMAVVLGAVIGAILFSNKRTFDNQMNAVEKQMGDSAVSNNTYDKKAERQWTLNNTN